MIPIVPHSIIDVIIDNLFGGETMEIEPNKKDNKNTIFPDCESQSSYRT